MPDFALHSDLRRDGIEIWDLPLSKVLMINDAAYPWFVLVPRVPNIKDAYQLTEAEHAQMMFESRALCTVLMDVFSGEKMNVAALGNMTPQLHVHHVVRYKTDPAWPGPIWGVQPLTAMTEAEIERRKAPVVAGLSNRP